MTRLIAALEERMKLRSGLLLFVVHVISIIKVTLVLEELKILLICNILSVNYTLAVHLQLLMQRSARIIIWVVGVATLTVSMKLGKVQPRDTPALTLGVLVVTVILLRGANFNYLASVTKYLFLHLSNYLILFLYLILEPLKL